MSYCGQYRKTAKYTIGVHIPLVRIANSFAKFYIVQIVHKCWYIRFVFGNVSKLKHNIKWLVNVSKLKYNITRKCEQNKNIPLYAILNMQKYNIKNIS